MPLKDQWYVLKHVVGRIAPENFSRDDCEVATLHLESLLMVDLNLLHFLDLNELCFEKSCFLGRSKQFLQHKLLLGLIRFNFTHNPFLNLLLAERLIDDFNGHRLLIHASQRQFKALF